MHKLDRDDPEEQAMSEEQAPLLIGRAAGHVMSSADPCRPVSSLKELLREYRMHLAPGAHYFLGQYADGCLTEILEIYVPLHAPSHHDGNQVVFAFFEKGYPPADDMKKGFNFWRKDYPFSHDVASTSEEFQEQLRSYINIQLERMYA